MKKQAIKKAYSIFKKYGTGHKGFEKAWRAIEINYPSILDPSGVIAAALQKYNNQ